MNVRVRLNRLSHKNLALGSLAVIFSLIVLIAFLVTFYTALQAINPVAAFTALFVAVIGIVWFKKTTR